MGTFFKCLIIGWLTVALTACNSAYPSQLTFDEQIQAIVLRHVTSVALGGVTKTTDNDIRIFLSAGSMKGADPRPSVITYVTRWFKSARPYTAAEDGDGKILERETGKKGVVIWIAPFSISNDGPITIEAGYRSGPSNAVTYEYRLQRVKGRWKILDYQWTKITRSPQRPSAAAKRLCASRRLFHSFTRTGTAPQPTTSHDCGIRVVRRLDS